ncbi:MAG: methylmalonyl-CoA mutase family protein [Myxococcales bacterium]
MVAHETEVADTIDPLGGSYFVEALTDEMEKRIREVMDRIDGLGGFVEALKRGWVQKEIARRAYEHQRGVESGEVTVVGVNRYRTEEPASIELHPASAAAERERRDALARLKRERDGASVRFALEGLLNAAHGRANLMPAIRAAVRAYATVGEIAGTLKQAFGRYQPPTAF